MESLPSQQAAQRRRRAGAVLAVLQFLAPASIALLAGVPVAGAAYVETQDPSTEVITARINFNGTEGSLYQDTGIGPGGLRLGTEALTASAGFGNWVGATLTNVSTLYPGDLVLAPAGAPQGVYAPSGSNLVRYNGTGAVDWSSPAGPGLQTLVQTLDFDGDGLQDDVAVANAQRRVVSYTESGVPQGNANIGGTNGINGLAAVDIYQSGAMSSLALAHQNGRVYLFDSTLNQLWRYDTPNANPVEWVRVTDLDGDGYLEHVVAATDAGEVYVLVGTTNPPGLVWSYQAGDAPVGVSAFDVAGKGKLDGVLVATAGWVTALNATGSVAWNYSLTNATATAVAAVDWDSQGNLSEVAVGLSNGSLLFLGGSGTPVGWAAPLSGNVTSLSTADLDEDGFADDVLAANDSSVAAVRSDGSVAWSQSFTGQVRTVRAADMDGLGRVSAALVATSNGVFVFNRSGVERWNVTSATDVMDLERAPVAAFRPAGSIVTRAIDAQSSAPWGIMNLTWSAPSPSTSLVWQARSGSGTPANISWGNWSSPQNSTLANLSAVGRFLQVRINLSSGDPAQTPRFGGLTVNYSVPATTGWATTPGVAPAGAHQFLTVGASSNLSGGGAVRFFYSADGGSTWRQFAPPAPIDPANVTAASVRFRVELDAGAVSPSVAWVSVSYVHTALVPAFLWPAPSTALSGTVNLSTTAPSGLIALNFSYYNPATNTTTQIGAGTLGPSNATWVRSWNTTGLDLSNLTLVATGQDARGFTFRAQVSPVAVDNTPPAVTVVSPAPGQALTGNTLLRAQAAVDTFAIAFVYRYGPFNLSLGNATRSGSNWDLTWNTTPVGTIENGSIVAVATDQAGLLGTASVAGVTVDNDRPWVRIDSPIAPSTIAGNPRVNLTASPDAVAVAVSLNGIVFANATRVSVSANSSLWTVAALNTSEIPYAGAATIRADVRDRVNLTGTNSSGPFTVDNTLPTATLISPVPGGVYTGVVHVAAMAPAQVTRVTFYYQAETDPSPTLIRDLLDADRSPSTGYYEFDWDTRSPSPIDFTGDIVLRAYSDTNQSGLIRFPVTIDNTAPYVDFIAPAVGETHVVGLYTVRAVTTADASAVTLSYSNQSSGLRTVVGNMTRTSPSSWTYLWNTTGIFVPSATLRLEAVDLVGFTSWVQRTDVVLGSGPGDLPPRIVGTILDVTLQEDFGVYEFDTSSLVVDEDPGNVTVFVEGANPANVNIRNNGSRGLVPIYFISVQDQHTNGARIPLTLRVVDKWGQSASAGGWGYLIAPVNDPPVWQDVPERLFVHHDAAYRFNFAPYIYDVENRTVGLWQALTLSSSDTAHVTAGAGLNLSFEYPQSFLGTALNMTLSVTDNQPGSPTAFTRLEVVVTDDWMPESIEPLPDVWLFEDVPKENLYNLNDYFHDQDNDPIFYYRGKTNLTIRIDADGNVSVTDLPPNWYGDQVVLFGARDPQGAFSEAPAVFHVVSVNDPPKWELPSSLAFNSVHVHFDVDHVIAYGPFVSDVDTPQGNLSLATDDPVHAFSAPGAPLTLLLRYNESFNGTVRPLRIWVTDGAANSTILLVNVSISDNYPPVIIRPFPLEVVMNEGETLENALNLFDYFRDRDGVLFFAFGAVNIEPQISNQTGWVTLSSPSDWSGSEQIVLRARDEKGAFQDAVLTITVLAVDDPPRLAAFPSFEFYAGEFYEISLGAFASDPDTPREQLSFTASSIYNRSFVIVFGDKLQLTYPEYEGAPQFDAVKVCVSDGGPAPTCRTIAVRVIHPVTTPFDWFTFFFIMGTAGAASVIAARRFFEFKVRRPPTVEDVFLVYEDGILIKHYSKQVRKFADDDVVTSMLSAIQSFAADSFEDTANWELREIAFQGRKILIERARKFQIFVIFDGDSNEDLKREVRRAAESIAEAFEEPLRDWDGDPSHFDSAKEHFQRLLALQQAFVPKGVTADELRRVPLLPGGVFVSESGDFRPLLDQYQSDLAGVAAIRLRPAGDAGVPIEDLDAAETELVEIPAPSGVPEDDESPHNGLEVALKALKEAVEDSTVAVRNRFPLVLFEGFDFVVDRYGFVFSKKFADQLKRMASSEGYILFIALSPRSLSLNQIEAIERDAIVFRGED